jgi:predicted RNA-binding Zn ribbon-like protein
MSTSPVAPVPHTSYVFDLDGGRACLDFANTLSSSGEHLNTYADLVDFAAQSQLITPDEAEWLQAEGNRDASAGERVLVRAIQLRESIRAIFSRVAADEQPLESDLEALNWEVGASLSHARLQVEASGGFAWGWSGRALDAPIWPITRSAVDLLTSDQERPLVRECGAGDCWWLFLDTSRNRSRQWCSMQSCGNREKARRHYQRVRQGRGRGAPSTAATERDS